MGTDKIEPTAGETSPRSIFKYPTARTAVSTGTASIDRNGRVLYPEDIRNQTRRAVENINALLQPDTITINDMAYLIVYLRNPFQYDVVREVLDTMLDRKLPRLYLQAKVCRPAWLIEIEAFGIKDASRSFPDFL